jgi:hypothetical protein
VPPVRRLVAWAALVLVVVVGSALGRSADVASPLTTAPAAAGAVDLHGSDDDARPCVLRADCAGAFTFGTAGLLLAVAVAAPAVGPVPVVQRVPARPRALRSALLPSGLFRPPQAS